MKIKQTEILKHTPNPLHVKNFLQGARIAKPKKGKGSFSRKEKHKKSYKNY